MTPKQHASALAKIRSGVAQVNMAEESRRDMLRNIGGVASSKDLDRDGIDRVIAHLEKLGAQFQERPERAGKKPTGGADRQALLNKIDAYLAEAELPTAYADGIAQRMYKVARVAWLKPNQLRSVIAALDKAAHKAGRPTA